jgi:manganese/zinc/iron transport system permease protein
MNWTEIDTWIVVTGALLAMACTLPGVFLVLNKQSMLGDAISHGVLPGVAIAFLMTNSREPWAMLLGAVIAGLLTGVLSQVVRKVGNVEDGASMGVVFCFLFALGLILLRVAADRVDLDPDCVLYGSIETVVVDVGAVPRVVIVSAIMLVFNAVVIALFYKELMISAFDPALANTLGFSATFLRQMLTVLTSVTTVMAFESVGSILVIAMLVAPPAAAMLLSRRLSTVIWIALAFAALSAPLGHVLAISAFPAIAATVFRAPEITSTSSAGMMAVAAGLIFAVCFAVARFRDRSGSRAELSTESY